jgi:hypothetical protein
METKTEKKLSYLSLGLLYTLIRREFDDTTDSNMESMLIDCAKELGFDDLAQQMQSDLDFINSKLYKQ